MKPEHQLNRIDHQILAILADDPGRSASELTENLFGDPENNWRFTTDDWHRAVRHLNQLKQDGYIVSPIEYSRNPPRIVWNLTDRGHAAVALSHVAELHAAY